MFTIIDKQQQHQQQNMQLSNCSASLIIQLSLLCFTLHCFTW